MPPRAGRRRSGRAAGERPARRRRAQEEGAGEADPDDRPGQVVPRRAAGSDAGDESAVLAQLVGRLVGLEGERRVEVGEADGQQEVEDDVDERWAAGTSPIAVRDVPRRPSTSESREVRRDLGREEQDADREDDRDDAGLVDAQRQEGRAALVHAPAADAAGVLDRDASLALLDVDDDGHDHDRQDDEQATPRGDVGLVEEGATPCGHAATMPAKMMKLMPLPMPRSVISSPIHITRMVPAARVTIWLMVSKLRMSKSDDRCRCGAQDGQVAVGLEQRQRHGQVARVLVDLVAAVLAFTLSAWRRGTTPVISCMMIEALMYGFTPMATIEKVDRPPPENRSSSCRNVWLLDQVARRRRGRRPAPARRPAPVDDEHPQHEQDAPADVRRAEGVDQGFEHWLLPRRRRSWRRCSSGSAALARGFAGAASAVGGARAAAAALGLRVGGGLGRLGGVGGGLGGLRPRRCSASVGRGGSARRFGGGRQPPARRRRSAAVGRVGGRLGDGSGARAAGRRPSRGASASARAPRASVDVAAGRLDLALRALRVNASAATKSGGRHSPPAEDLDRLVDVPMSPAARSTSALTVTARRRLLASRLAPGSSPARARRARHTRAIAPTLTTWYSILNGFLKPRSLGTRMWMRRLAALEPGRDRAARARLLALGAAAGRLALAGGDAAADARPRLARAGRGRRSCSFTVASPSCTRRGAVAAVPLRRSTEEAHGTDHAAHRRRVGDLDRLADAVQAERAHGAAGAGGVADRALDERHAQLTGHRPAPPRPRRRLAADDAAQRLAAASATAPRRCAGCAAPRSSRARR